MHRPNELKNQKNQKNRIDWKKIEKHPPHARSAPLPSGKSIGYSLKSNFAKPKTTKVVKPLPEIVPKVQRKPRTSQSKTIARENFGQFLEHVALRNTPYSSHITVGDMELEQQTPMLVTDPREVEILFGGNDSIILKTMECLGVIASGTLSHVYLVQDDSGKKFTLKAIPKAGKTKNLLLFYFE